MADPIPPEAITAAAKAIDFEMRHTSGMRGDTAFAYDAARIALSTAAPLIATAERQAHEHEWTRCPGCKQPGAPCPCSGVPCCPGEERETAAENEGRADGRAIERKRFAEVISPGRLRELADWFDDDDEFKAVIFRTAPGPWPKSWESRSHELQDDLRELADLLEGRDGRS